MADTRINPCLLCRPPGIIPRVTYKSPAMAVSFFGSVILEKCVVFVVLVVSVAVAIAVVATVVAVCNHFV